MEGNYADIINSRDNIYSNNSSLVVENFQSIPRPPCLNPNSSRRYFTPCDASSDSFNTPLDSFDFSLDSFDTLLDSSGLLLDSSAFLREIQPQASNNALLASFEPELPYAGNQYLPTSWANQPQTLDPRWDFLTMDGIILDHHESIQNAEETHPDENKTLNSIFNDSPEPKLDNHSRLYVCNHKSCNRKNFSNKSGLERHKREVHSSQQFTCPVPSCNRSKKGFHRRHNLSEHQRRVHSSQFSNSLRAPDINSEDLFEGGETTPNSSYEAEAKGSDRYVGVTDARPDTREEFKIKLQSLRDMREELDKDIKSIERVLSIMDDEY